MKKWIAIALCACMLLGLIALPAAAANDDTKLEVVRVLGILVGDDRGDLMLDAPVTRAQFAKMMTAASDAKDTVTPSSGASMFRDVKSSHWASGYIQTAIERGWVLGYVDGTYRPDRTITLEEGCTALLRMLGYGASSLEGAYPQAQLNKAQSVGLRDDLQAARGEMLSRRACVTLFYNLLTAQNASGAVYGQTLGYTVKNGEVDYASLIASERKGPYVAEGSVSLPFGTENVTVFRNGKASSLAAVQKYDVYYYHTNLRTVWAYSDRASGTLTAIAPNQTAPSSVTVAGVSYALETSDASYQFSLYGSFRPGDNVTLLLGVDGGVVRAVSSDALTTVYYGVVRASSGLAATEQTAQGASGRQTATTLICADGAERTFYHSGGALKAGTLASASLNETGTSVRNLSEQTLSGRVSADAAMIGQYRLADNAQILDTDTLGNYAVVYPSRLAGVYLESRNVRYYAYNANGEIACLILNEATGDLWDYALLGTMEVLGNYASYVYYRGGAPVAFTAATIYPVRTGGIALISENGTLARMRQLTAASITQLGENSAFAGGRQYRIADGAEVLLRDRENGANYYATSLSRLNTADYTLTGYYDDFGCAAGGRIRVIVAEEK